jgi:predicted esterase
VVFLHGAGGTNDGMACDLGINLNVTQAATASSNPTCAAADPANSATWNVAWLQANQVLAIFPQGQSQTAGGTPTWANRVMDSGQNDVAFLQSLASYIATNFPSLANSLYLAGHSNGGMMVNRMRCESPATFRAYVAMSGPASVYYSSSGTTPCIPSATAPYLSIMGGADTVLKDQPFTAATWTVASAYIAATQPTTAWLSYPPYAVGTIIGEYTQAQDRIARMCPTEMLGSPSTTATSNTWTNCGGKLVLVDVLNSDHYIYSLQNNNGGQKLIDTIATFIGAN